MINLGKVALKNKNIFNSEAFFSQNSDSIEKLKQIKEKQEISRFFYY
jgi:hypothetical protein